MKTNNLFPGLAVLLLVVLFSLSNYAQNGEKKEALKEKVEAQKIAYITNALSLTPTEAQQFWPVYNAFNNKKKELTKAFRKNNKDKKVSQEEISDKEALEMADGQIIQAQKILDLRKKYHIEFKKVLPPKKVLKLYQAEKGFRKHLLKKIKERRGKKGEIRRKR